MSHFGDLEFKWGKKKGVGTNKDVQFYDSFTYDGVEYSLYDCVYVWRENEPEPDIGRIVKIWETPNYMKKVKLVWFFRPVDIHNWLGDKKLLENEIFLASGEGTGISNLNPLEAISGKCNVVCTSKDRRNPQPSEVELRMADFIFYRAFDVGSCTILDNFPDTIAGIKVECFFNRKKDQELIAPKRKLNLNEKVEKSSSYSEVVLDKTVQNAVRDVKSESIASSENRPLKKRKLLDTSGSSLPELPSNVSLPSKHGEGNDTKIMGASKTASKDYPAKLTDSLLRLPNGEEKFLHAKIPLSQKRGLSKEVNFHEKASKISENASSQLAQDEGIKPGGQVFEVTTRPNIDTRRWFKQLPWEERMQRAHEQGTLILLENLDPSYTSSEVEDIVWHAFNQKVDAKMIECSTFSSPHYGKAFVIFKSKAAADSAISELKSRCLMLPDGRPLVGRRETPREPSKPTNFVGHLVIDKIRLQKQREEMRNAKSTSHCSQPNNIEYEMAIQWCMLQEKSDRWWKALHEQQAKEIEKLKSQPNYHRRRTE